MLTMKSANAIECNITVTYIR